MIKACKFNIYGLLSFFTIPHRRQKKVINGQLSVTNPLPDDTTNVARLHRRM